MSNFNISTLQNYYLRELSTVYKSWNKSMYHWKIIADPMVGIAY